MEGNQQQAGRESRAQSLTPSVSAVTLRLQLSEAWNEIMTLRRTVAHQARLLANLAPETHPAAPSVNCVYWLFSLAHEHEPSWKEHRNRLLPSLRGLGTMPAPDVTPLTWARHLAHRRREEQRGGGAPADHTLNIELGRLKSLLDWAVANQMIAHNPLRAAKYLKCTSRRETRLTQDDIDRLLAEAEDVRDKRLCDGDDDGMRARKLTAFVLCMFDSMLRFNEARHLQRSRIQADGSYTLSATETKSGRERTVVLTPRTVEAIAAIPPHPCGYVFANHESGKLHGEQTMRGWFRWACASSRLDAKAAPRDRRIVCHHLRHAGATEADAAGARPGALQSVLGHKSLRTVEQYLHRDGLESARHVADVMRRPPRRVPKTHATKK